MIRRYGVFLYRVMNGIYSCSVVVLVVLGDVEIC